MKTIEQEVKIRYEFPEYCTNDLADRIQAKRNAFKYGVLFAQRWIPISESMPQPDEIVLVKYDIVKGCDEITVLELSDDEVWHYRGNDFRKPESITHWRPIELK